MRYRYALLAAAAIGGCLTYQPAHAAPALTLSAAGIADGFSVSTYYSGDSSNFYGILALAPFGINGQLIADSYAHSQLYLMNDTDGQTPATILKSANVVGASYGLANTPSGVYYSNNGTAYYSVNTTTLATTPLVLQKINNGNTMVIPELGLWANPVTGDLISSSDSGLVDINPVTGTVHVITTQSGFDGVTVSPDGTIACGELGSSEVLCYNIASGLQVASFTSLAHSPDGTAFITGGTFNGDLIVNNNDGTVGLIDYATGVETIIASSNPADRGDFVSPDYTNGTLFLAEATEVDRLSIGGGGCIGPNCGPPPPPPVPEPSTLGLLGLGFVSLAFLRWRTQS